MDVRGLLTELCVDLGFCLPPEEGKRLEASPATSVDRFTYAVWTAEGMEPVSTDPRLTAPRAGPSSGSPGPLMKVLRSRFQR
jgi:hypothetical protein